MPRSSPSPLESKIAAALDWWREAGVDVGFTDEAHGWLRARAESAAPTESDRPRAQAAIEPAPAPPARQIGGPQNAWPTDLDAFRKWWLTEPSLDEGGLAPRVAPVGDPNPELMVLVEMPEEGDRDTLLSGPQGQLLGSFLSAAELPPSQVYRASVLPRHTVLPDWSASAVEGIGKVLAHHVALVQPKRLLAFGRSILPLCGHDPAQGAAALTFFHHESGRVPLLAEVGLDRLLEKAQLRARLWKRWLDWTDG
jgi:DNA polymerase